MSWHSIDSQADLDALNEKVCWEDSETVEYYATTQNDSYFPSDISRSGYINKNVHVLCRVCYQQAPYLEMVWIDCDHFSSRYADYPFMSGRVDNLKRVEVLDAEGSLEMRYARLIYRFLPASDVTEGKYFQSRIEGDET